MNETTTRTISIGLRVAGGIAVGVGIAFGPPVLVIIGAPVAVSGHLLSRKGEMFRSFFSRRRWWRDEE